VADRFDRRRVACIATLGEAAVALLIVAYVASSPTAVGPLFGLVLALGTARAFVAPASRSLPADIVSSDRLPWLVARWAIVFQVALVTGPIMAGSLYAFDIRAPFAASAALFGASSVAFGLLRRTGEPAPGARARPPAEDADAADRLHQALEGLRLVRRQPILLGAISLDLFAVLFGGAVALLPAIAEERLGVGAVGLGWLRAAPGIGAAAVMVLLAVRPVRRRVGRTLLLAVAVFGLATVVLGATHSYVVAFAALVVLAGADALSVFIRVTLVPLVTPASARGRVLAVENVFIGASNELGAFESGVTGQLLGPGLAVSIGGVATLGVAAAWWFLFPALRSVDRFPEQAATESQPLT
jgi:Major Facilitator Superfamily